MGLVDRVQRSRPPPLVWQASGVAATRAADSMSRQEPAGAQVCESAPLSSFPLFVGRPTICGVAPGLVGGNTGVDALSATERWDRGAMNRVVAKNSSSPHHVLAAASE